jgi:AcrR family transcriptional regulator
LAESAGSTRQAAALLPDRPELSPARARLFATAIVLFGERGYHGVSVRDITDALGQKPGAIYAHVRSKQELLFELVQIGHIEHRDRLTIARQSASDPVAQIRAIVTAHVLVHLEYLALARVTNGEFRFLTPEQVDIVQGIRAESQLAILDIIERGRQLGEFSVDDPFLAVSALGALGIRAAEWWQPDSGISPDRIANGYAEYAVKLLR